MRGPRAWSWLPLLLLGCRPQPAPQTAPPPPSLSLRPTVAIALGGGGARGFAHIGVLRVLEQEKIPIDLVVGTSVGSLVGALFADQGRVLDAEWNALAAEPSDLFDKNALSLFYGGFVKGERLESFLDRHLVHKTIESMTVRYAAVAVELQSGRVRVFDRGSVARAVHASCAIPGVFVPVEIDSITYVDGGVVDPVPADVARELGAEVVIALAVPAPLTKKAPKNPIAVAYHAATLMSGEIGRLRAAEADVVITIDAGDVEYDDFSQKRRLIEAGEAAARAALPSIHTAIAQKTAWIEVRLEEAKRPIP